MCYLTLRHPSDRGAPAAPLPGRLPDVKDNKWLRARFDAATDSECGSVDKRQIFPFGMLGVSRNVNIFKRERTRQRERKAVVAFSGHERTHAGSQARLTSTH